MKDEKILKEEEIKEVVESTTDPEKIKEENVEIKEVDEDEFIEVVGDTEDVYNEVESEVE